MYRVNRSAIVPYTPLEMYALVEDVDAYSDFLPWCGSSAVLERSGAVTVARVGIDFKGLKKSFVTENTSEPGANIEIRLREGPFRELSGTWTFDSVEGGGSRVELNLQFEFSGTLVDKLLGPVFKGISANMVDSFVTRARQVYGSRRSDLG